MSTPNKDIEKVEVRLKWDPSPPGAPAHCLPFPPGGSAMRALSPPPVPILEPSSIAARLAHGSRHCETRE